MNRRPHTTLVAIATLVVVHATFRSDAAGAEETKVLTPQQAIDQIGQPQVLVQMQVKQSKDRLEKRGIIFLDSEDDFENEKNLGVAISAAAVAQFKQQGIADPAAHFLGKTIRVRGCVMRPENRLYLPVHDPDQIVIVEQE
jgi:hypothetical protein